MTFKVTGTTPTTMGTEVVGRSADVKTDFTVSSGVDINVGDTIEMEVVIYNRWEKFVQAVKRRWWLMTYAIYNMMNREN